MTVSVAVAVFPVIFLGELPDKTMFASLALASRGRPVLVWVGVVAAFAVHVVIAVSVGVALFALLPRRVVDIIVAVLFAAGAVYSWIVRNQKEQVRAGTTPATAVRTVTTAAGVIFLAEWGDLTQILTANLAARYHDPVSVGVGSMVALAAVGALAVGGGRTITRLIPVRAVRIITAVVLAGLAAVTAVQAAR
ncbi:MAG: TMEM165/GDT1 family protein [Acidimicrobiales bacterium]